MNQALQDKIESEQYRKDDAKFAVGDSVRVHTKVVEGDKERIQISPASSWANADTG